MAHAKRASLYILLVLALYMIIATPDRAGDLAEFVFEAISSAARGVGRFLVELVK
jgi:hypothetical protein